MDFLDERTCAQRTEKIRELNDRFRATGIGGQLFITQAVAQLPPHTVAALIQAVREFNDFTLANDPYGEHDFGSLALAGEICLWKLDVYDLDLEHGSPDPTDEAVSRRILTVMLAADW